MITNGENTSYIKGIVKIVKRLFVGQDESKQKDISEQCSTKTAKLVWRKSSNANLSTINAGLLLFVALVISRLLPLPPNSEPLLGLAVLTPYITKNNLAFLLPLCVMFVSDLFLGFHNSMFLTYTALALAPFITKLLNNKYISLLGSWLVWHVMANVGQLYPPFSPEALLFDVRFLLSGAIIVLLYDIIQKSLNTSLIYNK